MGLDEEDEFHKGIRMIYPPYAYPYNLQRGFEPVGANII